jgi:probable phosphoglycerate mutase
MDTQAADLPVINYGLLRHGETVWNSEKRVQGQGDSPLTATGKKELERWARYLEQGCWQRILSSDLGRVQETVAILNSRLQLPVTCDKRLREQNWGNWEGLKVDDVRREYADELARQTMAGWDFRPPEGESRREVCDRVLAALLSSRSTCHEQKILVVCHLGVIKCLVYHVAGRKFLPDEPLLVEKNCLHEVVYAPDGYHLSSLNISHGDALP